MKAKILIIFVIGFLLASCASNGQTDENVPVLTVSQGSDQKTYSIAELKKLPRTEAVLNGVSYVGVAITSLLEAANIDAQSVAKVRAVASDGFSVDYEPALFQRGDVIVAYGTKDGALSKNDGTLRMVVPGEGGKLNPRMVVRIEIVPK